MPFGNQVARHAGNFPNIYLWQNHRTKLESLPWDAMGLITGEYIPLLPMIFPWKSQILGSAHVCDDGFHNLPTPATRVATGQGAPGAVSCACHGHLGCWWCPEIQNKRRCWWTGNILFIEYLCVYTVYICIYICACVCVRYDVLCYIMITYLYIYLSHWVYQIPILLFITF